MAFIGKLFAASILNETIMHRHVHMYAAYVCMDIYMYALIYISCKVSKVSELSTRVIVHIYITPREEESFEC